MSSLFQKIRRDQRFFQIVEDGVLVDLVAAFQQSKYKVHFNDMRPEVIRQRNAADTLVVLLLFSLLMNIILCLASLENLFELTLSAGKIVLVVLLSLFALAFVLLKERLVVSDVKTIVANKPLQFLYGHQHQAEVDRFIEEIFEARKQYFVKKLYKVDNILPYSTQRKNIIWLYQNQFITESDARFILKEIETQRIIGHSWDDEGEEDQY